MKFQKLSKRLLIVVAILILALVTGVCFLFTHKRTYQPENWNGTLTGFLISDQKPNFGLIPAPSTLRNALKKKLLPADTPVPEERGAMLFASVPAYFTDIEESAWTIYRCTDNTIYSCNLLFGGKTKSEFQQLYEKILAALEESLGNSDDWQLGSSGIEFDTTYQMKEFWDGYQVKEVTWSHQEPDSRFGYTLTDYFEPYSEGIMGIKELSDQYVLMLRITMIE